MTVAIGLLALVVLPVPFMRSIGIGGVLIPLVAIAVTLTLLPGDPRRHRARAVDWPRIRAREHAQPRVDGAGRAASCGTAWVAAGAGAASCSACCSRPFFGIKIGAARLDFAGHERRRRTTRCRRSSAAASRRGVADPDRGARSRRPAGAQRVAADRRATHGVARRVAPTGARSAPRRPDASSS